ncbi:MAG: biotin--[acetyl-CoA-carboxylase] ligase [Sphingomonadaceae bacterium]|uniref:biotin--[acetyl-CoA-carboxylase] ligase n=1 Tax=Thermaurantiacus sp. TaxID=2820283 RepID=UPI00298F3302|nr:biotin--[acetyl-CoA-carboxylase] ligase [Thermaurantiacus sp.]MCS6986684.1 biotin--[acetyl-CoA-carboxylase] ligase [Sphingomonadaceae bacterium]MDW8414053.1 biotin--[acetyl-CoA-carboxylase] ligase [Thermaurantiacus sp.]
MSAPILLPEVGSTNDWLLERSDSLPDGQWVRAERQTAGRGRAGRSWTMHPGNLAASVLVRLRPTDPPAHQLGLVAGVALAETAARFVAPRRLLLKWPNDLLLDGAKLAGILCERRAACVVVGLGVNLAQAPPIAGRATAALPPPAPDPDSFLALLASRFAHWRALWGELGFAPVREAWLQRAHRPGTPLTVSGPPQRQGGFAGLDAEGALLLDTGRGVETVRSGEVVLAAAGSG